MRIYSTENRWAAAVLSLLAVLAISVLAVAPARATPPDHATITDTVFGASDDRLFVLRTTHDNLGLHMSSRTETWLVAIDPQSGEETFWPVHAARVNMIWQDNGAIEREVLADRNMGAVNPFAILEEHGATSLLGLGISDDLPPPSFRLAAGVIEFSYGERVYALPLDEALLGYGKSVDETSMRVADAARLAPVSTRDVYDSQVSNPEECSFEPIGRPQRFSEDHGEFQIARMNCKQSDGMPGHSLIRLIPMKSA